MAIEQRFNCFEDHSGKEGSPIGSNVAWKKFVYPI